jgi:hypothetical protein
VGIEPLPQSTNAGQARWCRRRRGGERAIRRPTAQLLARSAPMPGLAVLGAAALPLRGRQQDGTSPPGDTLRGRFLCGLRLQPHALPHRPSPLLPGAVAAHDRRGEGAGYRVAVTMASGSVTMTPPVPTLDRTGELCRDDAAHRQGRGGPFRFGGRR